MKKLLSLILLALFCACACAVEPTIDTDEPDEATGIWNDPQSATPCKVMSWGNTTFRTPTPSVATFRWQAMNIGPVTCGYKTQVIVKKGGSAGSVSSPVVNGGPLAQYNTSTGGPKQAHERSLLVGLPTCSYKVWYKYDPDGLGGIGYWFWEGPFLC